MANLDLSKYGITDVKEVLHNPSYDVLFAEETKPGLEGFEKGQVTELGAVNVMTGVYTGRSPKDKFFVKNEASENSVWWTSDEYKNDNKPCTEEAWADLKAKAVKQLSGKRLFVVDTFCGANEATRMKVRFIMEVAWQAHFVTNMFIRPTAEELANYGEPDFVCFNASKAKVDNYKELGLNSETATVFNLKTKEQVILNLIRVNAAERFLGRLAGVSDPETKRKIIGEEFIRVFEEESNKLGKVDFLVQGTIYPDVVESGTSTSATIKSHHNVGGLPEDMRLALIEPLRELFKDEVRAVGEELGIPSALVWRQPFPGPGLAIRVLGEVTQEKLEITREADAIFREEIAKAGLERKIWQYFACLPNIRSVGVMGDGRTYSHTVALRAVTSSDGMTSDWAHIPFSVLDIISRRIVNEVQGVNRIVYDITSKPPATIEWE